jgi:hypothetical protein
MNVLLSFNDMFKWKGPLNIKWNNPFGYPDRTWTLIVVTLTLGSRPKQGLTRGQDKREIRETHLLLLGVQESVRDWTLTLPRQLPLGELESQRTPKSSRNNCRNQTPSVRRVVYIIRKLWKRRCLKWAHITHLDI